MNQSEFIYNFNKNNREQFNPYFFNRDDMVLVETMKKLILSLQRDSYFTIRVDNFTLVQEYSEIMRILREYEQQRINRKKSKNKDLSNKYDSIPLYDSDLMLLIVDYFIQINDGVKNPNDTLRVYILLPKIVDKYYYRLNGKLYSAIYQIVDGSTYNNSIFSAKIPTNTFKTVFMPCRVYRYTRELITINGELINSTLYAVGAFKKVCMGMEYILAKFGFQGALDFLGINGIIYITKTKPSGDMYDDCYVFERSNVYITVPKNIFDNDKIVQSFVATLDLHLTKKKPSREKLYTHEYWIEDISTHFISKGSIQKGLSVLDSFENIYDECIHQDLKLPDDKKKDMYDVLKWIMCEFDTLKLRDIVDVSTKKVRREEYIASIYISKVVLGIYRSSDVQGSITIDQVKRWINTAPDFLINRLSSDRLVTFRNNSNDIDSITALKYSYKGISGLGEKKGSAIPEIFKQLDYSSLGRTDPDSSSNTDPGITGVLCPLNYEMDGNYFSDYQEPNSWDEDFEALKGAYLKTFEMYQAMIPIGESTGSTADKLKMLDECMSLQKQAMDNIVNVDEQDEYVEGMVINNYD